MTAVFWDVAPCSLIESEPTFQGVRIASNIRTIALMTESVNAPETPVRTHDVRFQKRASFIIATVGASNLSTCRECFLFHLRTMILHGKLG
jgi:hypothetical protein